MEKLRTHIQHIAPINDEEFEEIKTHFTVKRVRKGQYLLSEGDEVKYEYFVLSGATQQRYEEFARLYPTLMQQIPKKLIAEFLRVSRETLSRLCPILKKFKSI